MKPTIDVSIMGASLDTGLYHSRAVFEIRTGCGQQHLCSLGNPQQGCRIFRISEQDWYLLHVITGVSLAGKE